MDIKSSFWVVKKNIGHFSDIHDSNIIKHPLSITSQLHMKNISNYCVIKTMRVERYSDNSIGLYLTASSYSAINNFIDAIPKMLLENLAYIGPSGPIGIRARSQTYHTDLEIVHSFLETVDKLDPVYPPQSRQVIIDYINQENKIDKKNLINSKSLITNDI